MQQAERPSLTSRKWIAALVATAVVAILAIKAYGPQRSVVPDPFDVSVLAAGAEVDPNEPWPSSPSEQVLWALRHKQPAMILFYSTLCNRCMAMRALVQVVKRDYQPDVAFIEALIDNPAHEAIVRWAKIGSIPASYFLTRSGEGKRIVGLMKQVDLRAELARLAAND